MSGGPGCYVVPQACRRHSLGSLIDACFTRQDDTWQQIRGPAAKIVSIAGEVREQDGGSLKARLSGVVADTDGNVHGGIFVAGFNPICITFEVTLEERLPLGTD